MTLPRDDPFHPQEQEQERPARGIPPEKLVEESDVDAHASEHSSGGNDPVSPGGIGAAVAGHGHKPLNNYAATAAPGATDDETKGYEAGSLWVNLTTDACYQCADATEGAAVWQNISAGAAGAQDIPLLDGDEHNDTVAQGVTEGSLIVGNDTPAWTELVVGADGLVLTAQADGSLAWEAAPGGAQDVALLDGAEHNDTAAGAPSRGDVIVAIEGDLWGILSPYEVGEYLRFDGTDAYWGLLTIIDHDHTGDAGDGGSLDGTYATDAELADHEGDGDAHHDLVTAADGGHVVMAQALASQPATTVLSAHAELATVAEANAGTDTGRACTPDSIGSPKRTIGLTAQGGAGTTTAGCAGPTQQESTTHDVNYWTLDFDKDSDEHAFWSNIPLPDNWNALTLTAKFFWTCASGEGGAAETVLWAIQILVLDDNDPLDSAWGAAVSPTEGADTWSADEDVHETGETGAITPGAPVAAGWGDMMMVRVYRDVSGDDLDGDAQLLAVRLIYTCEGYEDIGT